MSYSYYRRYRRNKRELLFTLNKYSPDENHRNSLTDDSDNINVSMSDTEVCAINEMPYSSAKSGSSAIHVEYIDSLIMIMVKLQAHIQVIPTLMSILQIVKVL